jgi:hypothetical protein
VDNHGLLQQLLVTVKLSNCDARLQNFAQFAIVFLRVAVTPTTPTVTRMDVWHFIISPSQTKATQVGPSIRDVRGAQQAPRIVLGPAMRLKRTMEV